MGEKSGLWMVGELTLPQPVDVVPAGSLGAGDLVVPSSFRSAAEIDTMKPSLVYEVPRKA